MIAPPVSCALNQPWLGDEQYARMKIRLPIGISFGSTATLCQNASVREAPDA